MGPLTTAHSLSLPSWDQKREKKKFGTKIFLGLFLKRCKMMQICSLLDHIMVKWYFDNWLSLIYDHLLLYHIG